MNKSSKNIRRYTVFLFLLVPLYTHALSWCTTSECFQSRTVMVSAGCVYECGTRSDAYIQLGGQELGLICKSSETDYKFCADATNEDGTKFKRTTTTTNTTTTTTGTTNLASGSETEAEKKAREQQEALAERQYQESYQRFMESLESGSTTNSGRNIQRSEVPWDKIFRSGTKGGTTTLTSTTTTAAEKKRTDCPDTFTRNFRRPASDPEVKKVQQFLNIHAGSTIAEDGPQSKGKETSQFNTKVYEAVKKFQAAYFDEILKAAGEKAPTGFWGPYTRRKANALLCSGVVTL